MKIKYAIAFNWGNLAVNKFVFEKDMNLIVGETGSGKSTLLDMIQAVMTADHSDLKNYNAGQTDDSTKKRVKIYRSYAAYILGADEKQYTRQSSQSTTALIFENDKNEVMTAWIHGSAQVVGTGENRRAEGGIEACGICLNKALEPEDFIELNNKGEKVLLDTAKLSDTLRKKYGQNSEIYNKKQYLIKLYTYFNFIDANGRTLIYDDVKKAAKAFVKYIYPTQTDDVHRFVKNELLERIDLSSEIKDLQKTLQNFKIIEREAKDTNESKKSLATVLDCGNRLLSSWEDYLKNTYLIAKRRELRFIVKIEQEQDNIVKIENKSAKLHSDFETIKSKINSYSTEKDTLLTQASVNPSFQQKNELDIRLGEITKEENRVKLTLSDIYANYQKALNSLIAADSAIEMGSFNGGECLNTLRAVLKQDYDDNLEKANALSAIGAKINNFVSQESDYFKYIENEESKARTLQTNNKDRLKVLLQEIELLSNGGKTTYPNQADIDLINSTFPNAHAAPVCEFIDILDEEWQGALEGFIKGDRFAIYVNPEYESKSIRLLLENKRSSKILQGSKLLEDYEKISHVLHRKSMVNLLSFTHETIKAFMVLKYGNVLVVETEEELRFSNRGIMKDGMGASGYTLFPCFAIQKDRYIGEKAKVGRLVSLHNEKNDLESFLTTINIKVGRLRSILSNIRGIKLESPYRVLEELLEYQNNKEGIQIQIQAIDISDYKLLQERIQKLSQDIKALEIQKDNNSKEIGGLDNIIRTKTGEIERLKVDIKKASKEVSDSTTALKLISFKEDDFESIDEAARKTYTTIDNPLSFKETILEVYHELKDNVLEHNKKAINAALVSNIPETINESIESFNQYKNIVDDFSNLFNVISENILVKKLDSLQEYKEKFTKIFKEEFVNRIFSAIKDGEDKLSDIRRMLRKHKFGNERFTIESKLSREFENMYHFMEYMYTNFIPGPLGNSPEIPEEYEEAKEQIEHLLMSEDESKSMNELYKIADYRNYREYDIKKIYDDDEAHAVSLDKLATDSGGQATTSYYIIRSIAAFSAFGKHKKKNKDRGGLSFLLIDEAFNRVDDKRPATIIEYLTKELGFQIICAMPPQNEGVFAKYAQGRYEIFKDIIDSDFDNYQVVQQVQYSKQNIETISMLIDEDTEKIKKEVFEQSLIEFNK